MATQGPSLNTILERVRKMVEVAEAPIAPGATPEERAATLKEQATARAMADAMMLKYAIDQATLRASDVTGKAASQTKPKIIRIDLCGVDNPLKDQLARLVWAVCDYTRCQAVIFGLRVKWTRALAETYKGNNIQIPKIYARIYGFESDLRYFEIVFTTLHLHLANGIDPKPDKALSLEENAYTLHSAGLNWLDIARFYGWPENGEPATMAGSRVKRAYHRYCRDHRIAPVSIPASGRVTFQRNFAQAYVTRIRQRFAEAMSQRQKGHEILLASNISAVWALYEKDNPKAKSHNPKSVPFNREAYGRGTSHANAADLNGARVGQPNRKQVR